LDVVGVIETSIPRDINTHKNTFHCEQLQLQLKQYFLRSCPNHYYNKTCSSARSYKRNFNRYSAYY